ncbi:hypothetical protein FOPE_12656 [Fonsecaea pedrosoi]|nr:hypothetical protein FOPE_12656 [Fonsecaea pedrosoi]
MPWHISPNNVGKGQETVAYFGASTYLCITCSEVLRGMVERRPYCDNGLKVDTESISSEIRFLSPWVSSLYDVERIDELKLLDQVDQSRMPTFPRLRRAN